MKRLSQYFNFIGNKLKRSVERFPETLFVTLLLVIMIIVRTHMDYDNPNGITIEKLIIALAILMPITAGIKLATEKWRLSFVGRSVLNLVAVLMAGIYYLIIPDSLNEYFMMRFVALYAMLFIGFLVVPYFYNRKGLAQYILYLYGRFFLTALYAVVIFGGISMMIFTIESLFNLNFNENIYFDLFIVLAGVFGVTFFLGSFPEINEDVEISSYSKIFKTLFLYIVLPIVSVYTVILYAYFVKILIEFELPQGLIGNLVLWYAMVSALTLFFVRDLKDEVPWLKKFMNVYIPLMIVPLVMLFIAIGIRIDGYGVTMPRYFVVSLALFLTFALAIMRLKKTDISVPVTLMLIAFIGVSFFGVFSGYSVTLTDQNERLETMFVKYGLKDSNGNFVAKPELDESKKIEVSDQIQFLTRNYEIEEIKALPVDFDQDQAASLLGFELYGYWRGNNNLTYFNYYNKDESALLDVSEADYMILNSSYNSIDDVDLGDGLILTKEQDLRDLRFVSDGKVIAEINLEDNAKTFYLNQNEMPFYEFELPEDGGKLVVSLNFKSINGHRVQGSNEDSDEMTIDMYEVWIMMGIK
ncbi:MAG: DUF4153 domain-containing protein [Clostridiales bacterium]|nr:DUF4153 domain-containing protein [Clostridiales bacterium]